MILIDEERALDSPFIERVWRSHSEGVSPFLSIAVNHCEFVVSRLQGKVTMTLRGPETKATPMGNAPTEGEWVGILLKLGTFSIVFRRLIRQGVRTYLICQIGNVATRRPGGPGHAPGESLLAADRIH